jgi:hypothetical protein
MKQLCAKLLQNKTVVAVLIGWVCFLILFSLFYGTTGLKEGLDSLFASEPEPVAAVDSPGTPVATSMALFQDNRASADCCPSAYSTSTGCICMTDEQLQLLRTRGGNRSTGQY